ncbi:MAG: long-chain fatty acid--CoA ligase, partial [Pseudomonadota bacterium]
AISFRELDWMVSRFAAALKVAGIRQGDRVSLVLPNIIQTATALYGVLRAGATAVMHSPRADDIALKHQFNDAKSKMAVCLDVLCPRIIDLRSKCGIKQVISCHIRDYLPFAAKHLFPIVKSHLHLKTPDAPDVYEFTDFLESAPTATPVSKTNMEDTAFILYTSATTGQSKGVELTHRNVSMNVQQIRNWFPSFKDGRETVVGCLPFFHVFGLTCGLNIGIFYGYTDVLVPLPEPKSILGALASGGATFIAALPTMYNGMVNEAGLKKYDLTTLKGCFSGGAPLPLDTIKTFEQLTKAQICEGYGLTETSPVTHINPHGGKTKVGTIGLPISNTEAKIVDVADPTREITTYGVAGELCVRGPQVMKGYVNLPRDTKACLVDGWLFTGDVCVMDSEGYFTVVDRKKDMILSQGENVYPREIEEVLFSHPMIQDAAVIGIPNGQGGEAPKAFVVLKKGEEAGVGNIIDHCRKRLGPNQVPIEVEFLTDLPRSPVGKTQRKELKRRHIIKSFSGTTPRTDQT